MHDSPSLSDEFDTYQYWLCHLLATQDEDGRSVVVPPKQQQQQQQQPLQLRQSRLSRPAPHDVEPHSQPISPTSDSVDMHAMLNDFSSHNLDSLFLAFRPTSDDIPESVASTHISDSTQHTQRPLPPLPPPLQQQSSSPSRYDDPHTLHYLSYGMDIDMDLSCLDDVDEQLVFHPLHAFLIACWAEATEDDPPPPQTQTRVPVSFFDQRSQLTLDDDNDNDNDTDESSFYSDSTATPRAEEWIEAPAPRVDKIFFPNDNDDDDMDVKEEDPQEDYFIPALRTDQNSPSPRKIDGYFTGCDPRDAIHFYPVSPLARELRGRAEWRRANQGLGRITRFCANLPRRLVHPMSTS